MNFLVCFKYLLARKSVVQKQFVWVVCGYDVFIEHWVSIMPPYTPPPTQPQTQTKTKTKTVMMQPPFGNYFSCQNQSEIGHTFELFSWKAWSNGKLDRIVLKISVQGWRKIQRQAEIKIESFANIILQFWGSSQNRPWLGILSEPKEIKRLNRSISD